MPLGAGHRFTSKEHRRYLRLRASYQAQGWDKPTSMRFAWATVVKQRKRNNAFKRLGK